MSGETGAELAVVFSELVSNASKATGVGESRPTARAWIDRRDVVIEVENRVANDAPPVRADLGDPLRHGGRGLMIARAFTDELRVEAVDGTVRIQCRRRMDTEDRRRT